MKTVLSYLYELQRLQFFSNDDAEGSELEVKRLREKIPADIFDGYERFRVRGRKGVAVVRNCICGECHLRVPTGTIVAVMHGEIQRCGNCGRFLYLPEDASLTVSTSSSAPRTVATARAIPAAKPKSAPQSSSPRIAEVLPKRKRKKMEPTAQAA